MNINYEIRRLVNYGLDNKLINNEDEIYAINCILQVLKLRDFKDVKVERETLSHPQSILDNILDYAYYSGVLEENSTLYRDLLDTQLMGCLTARPSEIISKFNMDYKDSPRLATDNYYNFSIASNYIRKERTDKNISWRTITKYGELNITINLSRPENDPKVIAESRYSKDFTYPKCLLCRENEGYAGRINHPARQNLRVIPIELNKEQWFLQYSPYAYYKEHCIVFKSSHEPMKINKATFTRLLEFIQRFPHYFIGSNADLPIVGGSILSHDHYQGGCCQFALEAAQIQKKVRIRDFEDVEVGIVKWPMSVIRLRANDIGRLASLSSHILEAWKVYSDESVGIAAKTKDEPHNAVTPIARYKHNKYEMDIVLRNNRTSGEYPFGVFHPHAELHNIKKENIGLIEVMGLAVLPARLVAELDIIRDCLEGRVDIKQHEELQQHIKWYEYIQNKYKGLSVDYQEVLKLEVGYAFEKILSDAGVFKHDGLGLQAFERFINKL